VESGAMIRGLDVRVPRVGSRVVILLVGVSMTAELSAAAELEDDPKICDVGGKGVFFPMFRDADSWEQTMNDDYRAIMYAVGLIWLFLGVSLIADTFMSAIEVVTAKEIMTTTKTGAVVPVKFWNATVANLTLMALGSSAPEILLSVIETMKLKYFAGPLGPSTIVGSAAFNLFVIIAICIVAIPASVQGGKKIEQLSVYACTAFCSLFAYIWLVIILMIWTPDVVTITEAAITFAMFPLLVTVAWMLDNNMLSIPGMKVKKHITMIGTAHFHPYEVENFLRELEEQYPDLTPEKREEMLVAALKAKSKPSRAQYRMQATRKMTGGKRVALQNTSTQAADLEMIKIDAPEEVRTEKNVVNFKASAYSVLENEGQVTVIVTRSTSEGPFQVDFATEGVTANAGEDYEETMGTLEFKDGEFEKEVSVKIIDDDEPEEDEMFIIKLSNARPGGKLGSEAMTIVTIIDDDDPGLLGFKDEDTHSSCAESEKKARVFVSRFNGSSGQLTVDYKTVDQSALGGKPGCATADYVITEGTLTFLPKEMRHEIEIPLFDRKQYDKAETFKVVLSNVTGPNEKAKLAEFFTSIVTIVHDGETKGTIDRVARVMNINADKYSVATHSWGQQFADAITVGGGSDTMEPSDSSPGVIDYIMHCVALPFKLIFALVPPTDYCGGWACFFISLGVIGLVTACIGDMASLFGCSLGIEDEITAITFVALGTSLPDAFASKTAAVNDDNADASVGNVTGSNAVNVFLGLGLPWLIASIYWESFGPNEDWKERYGAPEAPYNNLPGDPALTQVI
jgi:solute carrier family 8 (sodium/calcium exchanger)